MQRENLGWKKTSFEDQNLGLSLEPKINPICFKKLWLQKALFSNMTEILGLDKQNKMNCF